MCFVNDELVLFLILFFSSVKVFRVWMIARNLLGLNSI